jgi:hypothetical protein
LSTSHSAAGVIGLALVDHARDRVIGVEKHAAVVRQPARERVSRTPGHRDSLGQREALGMLLEPLGAEQLLADQLFAVPRSSRTTADIRARLSPEGRKHRADGGLVGFLAAG